MLVVTGACGFIGRNLVFFLNNLGITNIILVDKKKNINLIKKFKYHSYVDNKFFLKKINNNQNLIKKIKVIFHLGANSSTVEKNLEKVIHDNYIYSKLLVDFCVNNNIKLIYASSASVYGIKKNNFKEGYNFLPANYYSISKTLVDLYVLNILKVYKNAKLLGLRYFNVYGPGEENKGRMSSIIYKLNKKIENNEKVSLFRGYEGFANGEQNRDFVYIEDCVKINYWFYKNFKSGIVNVGTGRSVTFNKIFNIIANYHNYKKKIHYIKMPLDLFTAYQNETKANLKKLRKFGYKKSFILPKEGIKKYLDYFSNN